MNRGLGGLERKGGWRGRYGRVMNVTPVTPVTPFFEKVFIERKNCKKVEKKS